STRYLYCFFFSSRRRHTRFSRDWSSDVCSSDLYDHGAIDRVVFDHQLDPKRLVILEVRGLACLAQRGKAVLLDALTRGGEPRERSEERRVGKECRTREPRAQRRTKTGRDSAEND